MESTRVTGGDATEQALVRDGYELLGYRAAVGGSQDALAAVRGVLRGFGPIAIGAGLDLPHFDLTSAGTGWQVRTDEGVVHTTDDVSSALAVLEWHVVTTALTRRDDLFQMHGASVCAPLQRAGLVLAGESGHGKTTLTLGLMLRGFVPFGDDVALLDPATLDLQPLRRAFHVGEETWRLVAPLSAGRLSGDAEAPPGYFSPPQWAGQPVPVRWVLFPEYRPQQVPQLARLSPAEAATAILTHCLSLTRTPRLALLTATRLTERAACYRFLTGDLEASIAMIQHLVAPSP